MYLTDLMYEERSPENYSFESENSIIYDKDIINEFKILYLHKKNNEINYYSSRAIEHLKRCSELENNFIFSNESINLILSLESTTNNNNNNNWFIRFITFLKKIFSAIYNYIKSVFLSFINWLKFIFAWKKNKSRTESEYYIKFKDVIKKIPSDTTYKFLPYRRDFLGEFYKIVNILENSKFAVMLDQVSDVFDTLKGILKTVLTQKVDLKDFNIQIMNYTDQRKFFDIYDEFSLFLTSITDKKYDNAGNELKKEFNPEKDMEEKLNVMFFGTPNKPKPQDLYLIDILNNDSLRVLENEFITRMEKLSNRLNDYLKKINRLIRVSDLVMNTLEAVLSLFSKGKKEDNENDPEKWSIVKISEVTVKYQKLVTSIVRNIKFSFYYVSTIGLNYRFELLKALKYAVEKVKPNDQSLGDLEELEKQQEKK